MEELNGTINCPICGIGHPHSHPDDVVEAELNARPAFEAWYLQACGSGKGIYYRISGWGLPSAFDRVWSEDYVGGPPAPYFQVAIEALWQLWRSAWFRIDPRKNKVFINRFADRNKD